MINTKKESELGSSRIGLMAIKVIFAALLTIFLLLWALFGAFPFIAALSRGEQLPLWYFYFYPFPAIYLVFGYLSCTRLVQGRTFLLQALATQIGLGLWALVGNGVINWTIFGICSVSWAGLAIAQLGLEKPHSGPLPVGLRFNQD